MTSRKIRGITIICELRQWSLDDERGHVTGTIADSKSPKDFQDGAEFTLMNTTLTAYPKSREMEAHYLARSQMGNYFLLMASERT